MSPFTPQTELDVLAEAAGYGPFFTVTVGCPVGSGWLRADELGGAEAAAELNAAMAASLGELEDRVAASTFFLGWAARLVAPVLACWQVAGAVLELPPSATYRGPGGDVCCAEPVLHRVSGLDAAVETVADTLFADSLLPLVDALGSRVARAALLGNVSSSLFGALRVMGSGADDAVALGLRLVELPALRGTAVVTSGRPPVSLRRRNCCLFYRIPGGGLCGDCVLDAVPAS